MNIKDEIFRKLLDHLHEGVYFVDRNRTILYWSKAAERISGFSEAEVVGSRCMDNILNHVDEEGTALCQAACPLSAAMKDGRIREERIYLHHKLGHRVAVQVRVVPFRDEAGEIIGAFEVFLDAAEQAARGMEAPALEEQALLDGITGLGNQAYTLATLKARMAELKSLGRAFGLLYIQVDSMEAILEKQGPKKSEHMIKVISRTIRNALRTEDFLGRYSKEAFVAILSGVKPGELKWIAERTRTLVEHSSPFRDSSPQKLTVSIAAIQAGKQDTTESMIQRAGALLQEQGRLGPNRVAVAPALETGSARS